MVMAAGLAQADISVIVVSYNTADMLGPCLDSIDAAEGASPEVFVVDNASTDGSAELVARTRPSARLLVNAVNRGFGAANNQALPMCRGRYIVLLNPDTVVRPGAFREMVAFMEAHPKVGLAGARLVNPDGTPQDSVSCRYPGQKHARGELSGLGGTIACVMGACQIVRAELMRRIGGFDEDFFLYGEDQDLCLRIRREGYDIGYVESAVVVHHGGQSERDAVPLAVWRKKLAAEYLFYAKHYRAETVRRIARAARRRAAWQIALKRIALPFAGNRARADAKLAKYRAVREAAESGLAGRS